ncbi:MAG: Hpt domain-containing protein [Cyanobacteria bacterium J06555_13]
MYRENTVSEITLPSTVPTLDTTNLESIGTSRSFLIEVCNSFLADAPSRIHELEIALQQAEKQTLIQTAHALKSLSSCIGAMRLFQICQFVEHAGREGRGMVSNTITQQIAAEYNNVQLAIQNYKNAQSITL